jgi:hypothetical protein
MVLTYLGIEPKVFWRWVIAKTRKERVCVLDLGCGAGNPPIRAKLGVNDWVVGDLNLSRLAPPGTDIRHDHFFAAGQNRCHFRTPFLSE